MVLVWVPVLALGRGSRRGTKEEEKGPVGLGLGPGGGQVGGPGRGPKVVLKGHPKIPEKGVFGKRARNGAFYVS